MKPVGIHKHIINCNDRRLVNNLYVSGWNISVNSIYMKSYKCNICNIKITGKLNEDPVLDHIAHNPFCAYVKLFSNLNHLYMGQTLIVYINIIVQLYFVISHLLIRYRNSWLCKFTMILSYTVPLALVYCLVSYRYSYSSVCIVLIL